MTSETPAPPAASSNKPRYTRRRSKKAADKMSVTIPGDVAGTAGTSGPSSPVDAMGLDGSNASDSGKPEKFERELLKDLLRRLKKQAKKLENIKRSEDKIKDLPEEEKATSIKINADERKKLQDKPITLAVLKELQEVHEKLQSLTEAEDKLLEEHVDEVKRRYDIKLANAVKLAREEGIKQGKEESINVGNGKVETLLKFLRLAGYRRSIKSDNLAEDAAIEHVLCLVYSGDEYAHEASMKLADGSSETVGEPHTVTFARVKELAHTLQIPEDEEAEPTAAIETTSEPIPIETTFKPVLTNGVPEEAVGCSLSVQLVPETAEEPAAGISTTITISSESIKAAISFTGEPEGLDNGWGVDDKPAEEAWVDPVDSPTEPVKNHTSDSDFQSADTKRGGGRGGRGGYRGRGDGNFRGGRGGRGGFRGDRNGGERGDRADYGGEHRGEHRGGERGEHRGGERGEHRGGERGEHRGGERGEHRGGERGEHRGDRGEHRERGEYRGRGRGPRRGSDFRGSGGRGDHQGGGGVAIAQSS